MNAGGKNWTRASTYHKAGMMLTVSRCFILQPVEDLGELNDAQLLGFAVLVQIDLGFKDLNCTKYVIHQVLVHSLFLAVGVECVP